MNKIVKDVLNKNCSDEEKQKELDSLSNDIHTAYEQLESILNDIHIAQLIFDGEYKYCKECDDYYLSQSFITKMTTEKTKICTYEDPINSGGNEYTDCYADIMYSICPKGHRTEIYRSEGRESNNDAFDK